MGKAPFSVHFQQNLCESLRQLVQEQWRLEGVVVCTEKGDLEGKFGGYIDIAIVDEHNTKAIVAIEIENKSSYLQAWTNIEKLKKWSHNSQYRACSLLHVFNADCNIDENQICDLLKYAKKNERQGKGFYYDFAFFSVSGYRMKKSSAYDLVDSRDFRARLWKLLEDAGLTG
jgi:hypothetical protein